MIVFSSSRREEQLGPEGAAGAHPHPQDVQDADVVLDGAHHGRHEHRQRHGRALQPAAVAHRHPLQVVLYFVWLGEGDPPATLHVEVINQRCRAARAFSFY